MKAVLQAAPITTVTVSGLMNCHIIWLWLRLCRSQSEISDYKGQENLMALRLWCSVCSLIIHELQLYHLLH